MKNTILSLAIITLASVTPGRAAVVLVTIPELDRSIWGTETRTFDLNGDGVNDLFFAPAGSAGSSFVSRVYPLNGSQILMKPTSTVSWDLARLGTGIGVDGSTVIIGSTTTVVPSPDSIYEVPNSNFIWNSVAEGELAYGFVDGGSNTGGPFFHKPYPGNYMAFSFLENGERHYGAFEIGMFLFSSIQFYRYAYESEPNTPFFIRNNDLVPEPSTAALTGFACGLLSLRRRRQRIPLHSTRAIAAATHAEQGVGGQPPFSPPSTAPSLSNGSGATT